MGKGVKKETANSVAQTDPNMTVAGRFTITKTSLPAGSPAVITSQHGGSASAAGQLFTQAFGQQQQQAIQHAKQQHIIQQQQQQIHPMPGAPQPALTNMPVPLSRQQQQDNMEYVQIDTSYQPHHHQHAGLVGRLMPLSMGVPAEVSAKKGVLSQLIDKVRSKDERKKSTASGVSSSSSGGTIPQQIQHQSQIQHHHHAPPPTAPATTVMGRRALSMYDAQQPLSSTCQYGTLTPMDSATSAVAALALATASNLNNTMQRESRPMYSRAKSFVKSKSDDERPPSKLSKESRARSAGQLETETLLRSLSTSSKDASRILSLYQGLLERESQQLLQQQQRQQKQTTAFQQLQQQAAAYQHHLQQQQQHQRTTHCPQHPRGSQSDEMPPVPKLPLAAQQHLLAQQQQQSRPPAPTPQQYHHHLQGHMRNHISGSGQGHAQSSQPSRPQQPVPRTSSNGHRHTNNNDHMGDNDDYQFLPMAKSIPVSRSQSAPPRKPPPPIPGTSGNGNAQQQHQQVRVYVHEEPRSTRSSPSGTLSKSLEESYLYGYLAQAQAQAQARQQQHDGGFTPSSSGGQSGYGSGSGGGRVGGQSAFTPLIKKPISMESLVSLSTAEEQQPPLQTNNNDESRKSSVDFDRRSVITVKRAGSKSALITRQHSWEAGTSATAQFSASVGKREQSISTPQLSPDDPFGSGSGSSSRSRHSGGGGAHHHPGIVRSGSSSGIMTRSSGLFYDDDDRDLEVGNTLHKADSFEGHEEAVRSIVAAVQETRSLQRKLQSS